MTKEEKMAFTINLAQDALNDGEMPIAACIFLDDELISKAYTTEKADERLLVHAELKALIQADKLKYDVKNRKKMQLFTTLEPCIMCYGAAMSFFLGEIWYSLAAPDDGAKDLIRFEKFDNDYIKFQKPKMEGRILPEKAKDLFIDYRKGFQPDSHLYHFATSIIENN